MILALLLACSPEPETAWVAPFDGQSAWPLDAPLEVALPVAVLPDGYPVEPGLIRVVDLDVGGNVAGELELDGRILRFWPEGGWAPGHAFAFDVDTSLPAAREPLAEVPEALQGEAGFATRASLSVADVVLDGGRLCVLLSQPYADEPFTVWADGLEVPVFEVIEVVVGEVVDAQAAPLHALCATVDPAVATVRTQLPSGVDERSPRTASSLAGFQSLHRVVTP